MHHILEWEFDGEPKLSEVAMLCRFHHRQIHSTEWVVRIRNGRHEQRHGRRALAVVTWPAR